MKTPIENSPEETAAVCPASPERLARLRAYWRTEDPVCREFLKLGTDTPADFEAVKRLFPYLRELCVCDTPRHWEAVADGQYFAFFAGHDLGCRHPELLEQILPGEEVAEGMRWLQVLQRCGEEERLTRRAMKRAVMLGRTTCSLNQRF